MNAGTVLPGQVQDRPLEQLRGRERLQYTRRRIRAYLKVLLTEPSKLSLYPTLRLLPFFALSGMALAMLADMTVPGPGLGPGFYAFTLVLLLFALGAGMTAAVFVVALEPIRSRREWHLASIQTEAGYAAFRYRRHPRRGNYQLVDLGTTHLGAGLGFAQVVPYLVDKLGDEPMHLTAATAKLVRVYEQQSFRAEEGNRRWPFRNYQFPMTRPATVASPVDPSLDL